MSQVVGKTKVGEEQLRGIRLKKGGKENRVGDVKKVAEGRERRREIRDWVSIERLLDAELREVIRLLTEKAKSQ